MIANAVILGAGLTGLSTALHLQGGPVLVVEREEREGGKAKSVRRGGHTFDITGHWLHLRDDRVKALVDDLFAPGDLVEIERRTGVWTHGVMLPYPFQANLHGLPLDVVRDCLVSFMEAQVRTSMPGATPPATFREFAEDRFGAGIAETFFVPYNEKLWGVPLEVLTPDWVQRFVPMPDASQIIGGALGLVQEGLGYNARFNYPKAGGIDALPRALADRVRSRGDAQLRLQTQAVEVDYAARRVRLTREGGPDQWVEYERLVSTLPLNRLIEAMPGAPAEIREAASRLRWVPWRWLDVATRTAPPRREHWIYVPERHLPFFRVGIYSNALPAMAPPGGGSLYVELADRSSPPDVDAILEALAGMGAITSPQDVTFAEVRDVECAYVLFDAHYRDARERIHGWLETQGIRACGRYGAWIYNSMEDSIIQGMEAAQWAEAT